MQFPSFNNSKDKEFQKTLRERVDSYFQNQRISKFANASMKWKTIFMFSLYFAPYFLLLFLPEQPTGIVLLLWGLMALGMSGIGLSIMHDANHSAYSKKKWTNQLLGYSMNLIGANAEIWKLQHNKLHHRFTNINGIDDDINTPFFLRFSPNRKRFWIHRFQFIYSWFFYGLMSITRVFGKEYIQLKDYQKIGLIPNKTESRKLLIQLTLWKLFYLSYIMVIPLIITNYSFGQLFLGFILMHFISGLILATIFQTAHIMPNCAHPEPIKETSLSSESWVFHEMSTTSNYAPKNKVFSWLIGGLNYQVEHHLFPSICHVHYHKLSHIVSITAQDYNIPYNTYKSFGAAIWAHTKMLYNLGRK